MAIAIGNNRGAWVDAVSGHTRRPLASGQSPAQWTKQFKVGGAGFPMLRSGKPREAKFLRWTGPSNRANSANKCSPQSDATKPVASGVERLP
jgi:hypothetical protein